jgi:hypothetical protein
MLAELKQFCMVWWRISLELTLTLVVLGDFVFGNIIVPVCIIVLRGDKFAFSYGVINLLTVGFIASAALAILNGLILALVTRFFVPTSDPHYWRTLRIVLAITILIPVFVRIAYGGAYLEALLQRQPLPWLLDLVLAGYNATEMRLVGPFMLALTLCLEIAAWWALSNYRSHLIRSASQFTTPYAERT